MKYVFVENHQAELSIKAMCRVLRGTRSGCYARRLRRHRIRQHQELRLICDTAVREAFAEAKQRYGSPCLVDELPEYKMRYDGKAYKTHG